MEKLIVLTTEDRQRLVGLIEGAVQRIMDSPVMDERKRKAEIGHWMRLRDRIDPNWEF